ncbi:2-dehydropantoate 2-reductase [Idiomarina sp. PL1-037]|uniref:ketopantoate reductase family protein n=1 Tax=Idiomarina sp. PL1-037 TaxID=3095365 RepID=UPI002ACBEBD8|nr:2-dehydropantoate 2-reductase [Idiomarina sp. PL1-037]WQC52288.1 2-dehydropantoate 2-reductase [Idiomarina sp. PL1-037]
MTKANLNWVVLGPGAIGGLIAGALLEHGQSVSLLPRKSEPREINWQVTHKQFKADYSAPVITQPLAENTVFVIAVKAFDLIEALQGITTLQGFNKTMPVVISHNGLVELPEPLKELNLHPLVTTHGAVISRNENGKRRIEHRGAGRSWLEVGPQGRVQPTNFAPGLILQQAFSPLTLEDDLSQRRWLKFVINCVINPLTAVHQCANGELLKKNWQAQVYSLVTEAVAVANSQNVSLTTEGCYKEVLLVAKETALNHSSMLQDVKQQRRTEIQQLTGYLISAGKKAGVATPTHQQLLDEFQRSYSD